MFLSRTSDTAIVGNMCLHTREREGETTKTPLILASFSRVYTCAHRQFLMFSVLLRFHPYLSVYATARYSLSAHLSNCVSHVTVLVWIILTVCVYVFVCKILCPFRDMYLTTKCHFQTACHFKSNRLTHCFVFPSEDSKI